MRKISKSVSSALLVVLLFLSAALNAKLFDSPKPKSGQTVNQIAGRLLLASGTSGNDAVQEWCKDRGHDFKDLVMSAQSREGRSGIEGILSGAISYLIEFISEGSLNGKGWSTAIRAIGSVPGLVISMLMVLILAMVVIFGGIAVLISKITNSPNTQTAQQNSEQSKVAGNPNKAENCPLQYASEKDIVKAEDLSERLRLILIVFATLIIGLLIVTYLGVGYLASSMNNLQKSQCVVAGLYAQTVDGTSEEYGFAGQKGVVTLSTAYNTFIDSLPVNSANAVNLPANLAQQSTDLDTAYKALPTSSSEFAYIGLDGTTSVTPPSTVKYVDGIFKNTLMSEVTFLKQTSSKLSNAKEAFGTNTYTTTEKNNMKTYITSLRSFSGTLANLIRSEANRLANNTGIGGRIYNMSYSAVIIVSVIVGIFGLLFLYFIYVLASGLKVFEPLRKCSHHGADKVARTEPLVSQPVAQPQVIETHVQPHEPHQTQPLFYEPEPKTTQVVQNNTVQQASQNPKQADTFVKPLTKQGEEDDPWFKSLSRIESQRFDEPEKPFNQFEVEIRKEISEYEISPYPRSQSHIPSLNNSSYHKGRHSANPSEMLSGRQGLSSRPLVNQPAVIYKEEDEHAKAKIAPQYQRVGAGNGCKPIQPAPDLTKTRRGMGILIWVAGFFTLIGFLYTTYAMGASIVFAYSCEVLNKIQTEPLWRQLVLNKKGYFGTQSKNGKDVYSECASIKGSWDLRTLASNNTATPKAIQVIEAIGGLSAYKNAFTAKYSQVSQAPVGKSASTVLKGVATLENPDTNGNSNDIVAAIKKFNANKCLKDIISFTCTTAKSSTSDSDTTNLENDYCIDPKAFASSGYQSRYSTVDNSKFTTGTKANCQSSLDKAIEMISTYSELMMPLSTKTDAVYTAENAIITNINSAQSYLNNLVSEPKISPVLAEQEKYPNSGIEAFANCEFVSKGVVATENYLCFKFTKYFYAHSILAFIDSWILLLISCFGWYSVILAKKVEASINKVAISPTSST